MPTSPAKSQRQRRDTAPLTPAQLKPLLLARFPVFARMPQAVLDRVLARAFVRTMPRGSVLFEASSPCSGFPLLLEGEARITKLGANGREIQLYRVKPGESCLMSGSCIMGEVNYTATGIADSDITALVLPPDTFQSLLVESPEFRRYVFGLHGQRLAEMMELVDAVAFQRLDQRLAALLLEHGDSLKITHQKLADDLGSVREIVSRLLRSFEDRGWVALGRERIDIKDRAALRRTAGA